MYSLIEKEELPVKVVKKKKEDKKRNTNCYQCEIIIDIKEAKESPNEGDKRLFCKPHWKNRFGKKKKLKKRY